MSNDTPSNPNLEQDEALLRGALPVEIQGRIRSARIKEGRATVVAEAGDLGAKAREELEKLIEGALGGLSEVEEVRVALIADRRRRMIIAVGSGKGGVGKSTLTTNLAVALSKKGRKVGVIDGDIYGPSQARLLATEKAKAETDGEKLVPIESPHGVKMLSMGNLVAQGKALAWRGPMASPNRPATGHRRCADFNAGRQQTRRCSAGLNTAGSGANGCSARRSAL